MDRLWQEFGVSVVKGISGNNKLTHFVLYDLKGRLRLLSSIIGKLPTDVRRQFIIDKCYYMTDKYGNPYHCISRSASGESTNIVVVYSSLVVVYSSLVCLP